MKDIRKPLTNTLFFFNDTATTEIYTLSLHDALPISKDADADGQRGDRQHAKRGGKISQLFPMASLGFDVFGDRKSTRLNSSHSQISYAVFCLKKKKLETFGSIHSPKGGSCCT